MKVQQLTSAWGKGPPPCPLKPHGTMKETSNRKSNLSVSGYQSTGNHMLLL